MAAPVTFARPLTLRAVTAATTVASGEFIAADATAAGYTVTGPAAGTSTRWGVKKTDSSTNAITVSYTNSVGTASTLNLAAADDAKMFEPFGSGYIPVSSDRSRTVDDSRYARFTAQARDVLDSTFAGPLRSWYAGLGNREAAPARIFCLGDSITEGQGATAIGYRWIDRLRDRLRLRFPTTGAPGGLGYYAVFYNETTFTTNVSTTGTVSSDGSSRGLKRSGAIMSSGATISWSGIAGTSFRVAYANNSAVNITVAVDGTTVGTIASSGSTVAETLSASFALTAGNHTVKLTANAGSCYTSGIYVYNGDEAAGIQLYDGGHYGWTSTNWVSDTTFTGTVAAIGTFSLVTIALGTNDFAQNATAATLQANITALIASLRTALNANPGPSFLLIAYSQRGDVTSTAAWADYITALRNIAAADTRQNVAVLDLSTRLPAPGTDNSLAAFAADLAHPSNIGHGLIADQVLAALTPR